VLRVVGTAPGRLVTATVLVQWIGAAIAVGTLIGLLGRGLKSVLQAFHAEHIAPTLANVTHALATNTEATAALTSALARTNEAQDRGFQRLGDIIADHETRITVLEIPQPKPRTARRKRTP
jgi:hypothetical protein